MRPLLLSLALLALGAHAEEAAPGSAPPDAAEAPKAAAKPAEAAGTAKEADEDDEDVAPAAPKHVEPPARPAAEAAGSTGPAAAAMPGRSSKAGSPPATPPSPPEEAPPGAPPNASTRAAAASVAHAFFTALIAGDAREAVAQSSVPFALEQRRVSSSEELVQEWLKNLRQKRTDLLTLYGIDLLTPAEMEKRYGRPPQRLASFPYREAGTWVAVANLSGHAAVALVRQTPKGYRVVGYTD